MFFSLNFSTSIDHWVLETYYQFKKYFSELNVTIGGVIPDEGVVFMHSNHFPKNVKPSLKQFFVSFQVDIGRLPYAHFHIAHNPFQLNPVFSPWITIDTPYTFAKTLYIDPWPIESIIKRPFDRGNVVKKISFHGNKVNSPKEIQSSDFSKYLAERDMEIKFYFKPYEWNDFSETDLSICIRNFTSKPYYSKPFLKITNSLLANVPVVAGKESSSKYFNKNILKIPIISTYNDLLKFIDFIKDGKYDLYNQVAQFKKISERFNDRGIVLQWIQILKDIECGFSNWRNSNHFTRKSFFIVRDLFYITNVKK